MADPLEIAQASKSYQDIQNLQNEFDFRKALAAQQLQTGGIDAATKANVLALQTLGSAQDQPTYTAALQKLGGIMDTSQFSPDFATGQGQVQAGLRAISPLGTLLNAATKMDANANTVAIAGGEKPANANALATAILQNGANSIAPGAGALVKPVAAPVAAPATTADIAPNVNPAAAIATIVKSGTMAAPASAPVPTPAGTTADATAPTLLQSGLTAPSAPAAGVGAFVPPPKDPTETEAAYSTRVSNLQKAYDTNPYVLASRKQLENTAGKEGDTIGEDVKMFNLMNGNLPQALARFSVMRDAAQNANSGFGVNNDGDGIKQVISDTLNNDTSKANALLEQAAAQNILPELGPQIAASGGKGNKFMESLGAAASGLRMSASPVAKVAGVNGLQSAFIENMKAAADRLRAAGYQVPSPAEIDASVSSLMQNNPALKTMNATAQIQPGAQQTPASVVAVNPSHPPQLQAAQITMNLRKNGVSDADIQQYLKAKGLQ